MLIYYRQRSGANQIVTKLLTLTFIETVKFIKCVLLFRIKLNVRVGTLSDANSCTKGKHVDEYICTVLSSSIRKEMDVETKNQLKNIIRS